MSPVPQPSTVTRRRWRPLVRGAVLAVVTGLAVAVLAGSGVRVVAPRLPAVSPSPSVFATWTCPLMDSSCTRAGTIRWSVPLAEELFVGDAFMHPLTAPQCFLKAGRTYYRYTNRLLRAYDAGTGAVRWSAQVPAPAEPYCRLYADAAQVMVIPQGTPEGAKVVTVLSADDGRLVGRWLTPYPHTSNVLTSVRLVAIDGGRSIWVTGSGEVCAVEQAMGQRVWTTPVTPFAGFHLQRRVLYLDAKYHRPQPDDVTGGKRTTRYGEILPRSEVIDRYDSKPCRRCYPDGDDTIPLVDGRYPVVLVGQEFSEPTAAEIRKARPGRFRRRLSQRGRRREVTLRPPGDH